MGMFTLEHSRAAYRVDFILYGAAVVALATGTLAAGPREQIAQVVALILAGLCAWSAIEYALHRFVLHGLAPFRQWHALHHERPAALICAPTILSAGLIVGLVSMSEADITNAIAEYVQAAHNALAAGFDGIELHAANGYLLEQFIRPNSNLRTDRYGGPIANRARFVLEVAEAVIHAIGRERVGMRLSPFGVFNDMPLYPEMDADYRYLAQQLDTRGLLYLHLVDHSAMRAPAVPASIKAAFRSLFKGALILSGGYDAARAEGDLAAGKCDLAAFGRPALANPDLLRRFISGAGLNAPDMSTFYTPGAPGYTDYPQLDLARGAAAAGALDRLFMGGTAARAVEELPHRGLVHARQFGHRADGLHLALTQHRDAVGDLPQQVEVVGDHDDGEAHQVAQLAHQCIDPGRALRIQAGGWLIEKQQLRIERARQRGAFQHAAGKLRRILRTDFRLEAGHSELGSGDLVDQAAVKRAVLAQRQADILGHGE